MMKMVLPAFLLAVACLDLALACSPPPPPPPAGNDTVAPAIVLRRRRSVSEATVTVTTLFDFDEGENAANVAALGQQLKQLAQREALDTKKFGTVTKALSNRQNLLRIEYRLQNGNSFCDELIPFVAKVVQFSDEVFDAGVSCKDQQLHFAKN